MKRVKKPRNINYCATVAQIKNIISLEGMDRIVHTNLFGNLVIVSKDAKIGDVGLYFPPETELSEAFITNNNLYSKKELNRDDTKSGYIDKNGRVKAIRLGGFASPGIFMPLSSLRFALGDGDISENEREFLFGDYAIQKDDSFDEINGIEICKKYIKRVKKTPGQGKQRQGQKKLNRKSRLVDNQYRKHCDTAQLGKNMHKFREFDTISATYKMHGTSVVISKVLSEKKLSLWQKFLKVIGGDIITTEYSKDDNLYGSRRVVKNQFEDQTNVNFYDEDIWKLANKKIRDYLLPGMTAYAEIVGYLPSGAFIQKPFDYGCKEGEWKLAIYRLTYTNTVGGVFEFSARQVQNWCKDNSLLAVHELFYGSVADLYNKLVRKSPKIAKMLINGNKEVGEYFDYISINPNNPHLPDHWQMNLLEMLKEEYHLPQCMMCENPVPAEGIVIRNESNNYIEPFKFKNFDFLAFETKQHDKGEDDIEERGEE